MMGLPICQKCKEEQEQLFQTVKKYVQDHPGADIMLVSEECEVDPAQIRQWIREERLQFADDSPIRIPCEKCGSMIRSGRFCEACKIEMTQGFNHAMGRDKVVKPEVKKSPSRSNDNRMRFL